MNNFMTHQIKDTGNGHILVKKGFAYAFTSLFVLALGMSWSFTWTLSADRAVMVETLSTHVTNGYIHNMNDKHVMKDDLNLYFIPLRQQLNDIKEDILEIKERLP